MEANPDYSTRPCGTPVAHQPHLYPAHTPRFACPGATQDQVTAAAMARKGARQDGWRHLVDAHGIPVSERAYGAKVAMWGKVDRAIHEGYDRGYADAMKDVAEGASGEQEWRQGGG
jgi:hypothetical protein